ncbi:unnamed protein product, partial [Angiostrongylus costaricensis]|uniref:Uncharacterized protein n=1 Tax=Angiostrongylus costaricensis TaxID=334426 RepID=A0A0R3PYT3_ANGCS
MWCSLVSKLHRLKLTLNRSWIRQEYELQALKMVCFFPFFI